MRQIYPSFSVLLLIVAISAGSAKAQKDTTKLNQSVEVVKAYHPNISNANKVNLMPVVDDTMRFTPEFNYSINSQPVNKGFTASPVGAADVNGLQSKELGLGHLKLGAGTLSTVYGDFFLNLPKSKFATFGMHLRHLSSDFKTELREGDLADAPYSQNNAEVFGSVGLGNTILSADLSYDRDAVRYYGYPVSVPAGFSVIPGKNYFNQKQVYQDGNFKVVLKSSDSNEGDLKFYSGLRFGFFDAKTGQKERSGGVFGKFDHNFGAFNGLLDLSFDHYSTDSIYLESSAIGNKQEDWLRVAPSVKVGGDNWSARGGINFVAVSDKEEGNSAKLYPDFEFDFEPVEGMLTLYAGLKGDFKNNRYRDIVYENYWADPRHNVRGTSYTYSAAGGIKGKIITEISYNLGLKYSKVKDMYFYILNGYAPSSGTDPVVYNNAFDVVYDDAGVTNFSAEFSYVSGKDLSVVLKGNYYNYSLESLKFASHKPDFDLTATGAFRIIDRLTGFADLELTGKRKALANINDFLSSSGPQTKEFVLDPLIRLNLGATYEMTGKFKLFGRVDNLLNRKNEQWLGYTSQGLRMLAGVAYSF